MMLFSAIGVMVIYLNVPTAQVNTTTVTLPSDFEPTTITLPSADEEAPQPTEEPAEGETPPAPTNEDADTALPVVVE